jgi:hypothetical protein
MGFSHANLECGEYLRGLQLLGFEEVQEEAEGVRTWTLHTIIILQIDLPIPQIDLFRKLTYSVN